MKLLPILSALLLTGFVAARIDITITEHSDSDEIDVKYNDYREKQGQELEGWGKDKDKGPKCKRREQHCRDDEDCCKNLLCRRGFIGRPLDPLRLYCQ